MKNLNTLWLLSTLTLALAATACDDGDDGDDTIPAADVIVDSLSAQPDFGNVKVGGSAQLAFRIVNEGAADATISGISTSGLGLTAPFVLSGGDCADGMVLHAGGSDDCTLAITFTPTEATKSYADITIHFTDSTSPATQAIDKPLQIVGNGVDPNANIPVNAHVTISHVNGPSFGSVALGNPTAVSFTVLNDGLADATLSGVSTSGLGITAPFSLTGGSCADGTILHGGKTETCTLTVTFAPTSVGAVTPQELVLHYKDAKTGTQQTNSGDWMLAGSGVLDCINYPQPQCPAPAPLLTVSGADPFDYGDVAIGEYIEHTFTINNLGNANAYLGTVTDAGLGLAAPFALLTGGTCSTNLMLAPLTGQCTIIVRFTPSAEGLASSALGLVYSGSQAGNQLATRAIQGTGLLDCLNHNQPGCPAPAPAIAISGSGPLSYGNVAIGSFSHKTLTVVNSGNANGTIGTITDAALGIAAPYKLIGGSCATGQILTSLGGSCTLIVELKPTAVGAAQVTLDVAWSNGTTQHATRVLTGAGVQDCFNFPSTPGCPPAAPNLSISNGATYNYGDVAIGTYQEHTFTVTNIGNAAGDLAGITSAGLGLTDPYSLVGGTCSSGQSLAAVSGSCTIIVRLTPTQQVTSTQTITVKYTKGTTTLTTTRGITGKGVLDCVNNPQPQCPPPKPKLTFSTTLVNFGNTPLETVKEVTLTVHNDGPGNGTLGSISNLGLSLSAPFSWVGGSCATNGSLPSGDSCTLRLRYTPTSTSQSNGTMSLKYSGVSGQQPAATLPLTGAGILDCSAASFLAGAYQIGVDEATDINQAQAAQGTADGLAAAYDSGYDAGYIATYNSVYNSTYNQYYQTSYNSAYNAAYNSSTSAGCSQGSTAGSNAGYSDGADLGEYDGYSDGYDDGEAVGYTEGYDDGYDSGYTDGYYTGVDDAEAACGGNANLNLTGSSKPKFSHMAGTATAIRARSKKSPVSFITFPDPNQQSCYNQGYGTTLDPDAYQDAYDAASQNSGAYNSGYSAGANAATITASQAGSANGSADGQIDGQADGSVDGFDDGYDSCYTPAYNSQFNSAYTSFYNSSYAAGDDDGYTDGYSSGHGTGNSDGFSAGYDAGYDSVSCFNASAAQAKKLSLKKTRVPTRPTQRVRDAYGTGKDWVIQLPNGLKVDIHVARPVRNATPVDTRMRLDSRKAMRELSRPVLRGVSRATTTQ